MHFNIQPQLGGLGQFHDFKNEQGGLTLYGTENPVKNKRGKTFLFVKHSEARNRV